MASAQHTADRDDRTSSTCRQTITSSNKDFQLAISPQAGAVVSLKSLKPTLMELLESPEQPLTITLHDLKEGWSTSLNKVRHLQVDRKLKKIRITVTSVEHPIVEADVLYDLHSDHLKTEIRLLYIGEGKPSYTTGRQPDRLRYIVVFGQPSVPMQTIYS